MSLVGLGLFKTWLYDSGNWLDVLAVTLVVYWTIQIHSGVVPDEPAFRAGAAFSLAVFWMSMLYFLKSTIIDFAVFIGGVLFVVERLAAFLLALAVILVAFSMMFVTVFRQTYACTWDDIPETEDDMIEYELPESPHEDHFPFCDFSNSIIYVYTMLLGEVSDSIFYDSPSGIFLFIIFMFLVVILLANVLIAIVTDSYGVIKNERAAIVFWSNRLDFVAEMDAIKAGPWKKKVSTFYPFTNENNEGEKKSEFGRETWDSLINLFQDQGLGFLSLNFFAYLLIRAATIIFIVFIWLPLGLATAGWLWAPQVREYLLHQKTTESSHQNEAQEVEKNMNAIAGAQTQIKKLQDELVSDNAADRKQMIMVKATLLDMREEIMEEMDSIREKTRRIQELHTRQ